MENDRVPATSHDPSEESSSRPDLETVAEALSACVRDALEHGEAVDVPGMGTFHVEHQPSEMREEGNDQFSVTPPRDVVAFEPAAS